jgi:hypothetical protein
VKLAIRKFSPFLGVWVSKTRLRDGLDSETVSDKSRIDLDFTASERCLDIRVLPNDLAALRRIFKLPNFINFSDLVLLISTSGAT